MLIFYLFYFGLMLVLKFAQLIFLLLQLQFVCRNLSFHFEYHRIFLQGEVFELQLLLIQDYDGGLASLELLLEYLCFCAFSDSALVLHFFTKLDVFYPLLQHCLYAIQTASNVLSFGAAEVTAVWEAI